MKTIRQIPLLIGFALLVAFSALPAAAPAKTDTLTWNRTKDAMDADVRDLGLIPLLKRIAHETGWHVYVEPVAGFKASTRFTGLPTSQALRRLLGDMNFAIVPQTNGTSRLYVFQSSRNNATQRVSAAPSEARRVPRELVIRAREGTDVEALAKQLGAKIVGHIPELNAYRFEFESEEALETARKLLAANPGIASVQDNFYVDPPDLPQSLNGMVAPEGKLTLDPPKADACKVIVGFVDTALQPMGEQYEPFIKERVSLTGQSSADNSSPTHATAMVNAYFQALRASGRTSSSVPIISVDVFGGGDAANTFNVAKGMILAANKGATVINASLGGYGDSGLLRDAVKQLAAHNIPVFAAVGNDASRSAFFPAAYPEVISVTALERGQVAPYANLGTTPDVATPGAVLFNYNGMTYGARGTSVSSAAATGIAAGLADANCAPWTTVIPAIEKNLPVPGTPAK